MYNFIYLCNATDPARSSCIFKVIKHPLVLAVYIQYVVLFTHVCLYVANMYNCLEFYMYMNNYMLHTCLTI